MSVFFYCPLGLALRGISSDVTKHEHPRSHLLHVPDLVSKPRQQSTWGVRGNYRREGKINVISEG